MRSVAGIENVQTKFEPYSICHTLFAFGREISFHWIESSRFGIWYGLPKLMLWPLPFYRVPNTTIYWHCILLMVLTSRCCRSIAGCYSKYLPPNPMRVFRVVNEVIENCTAHNVHGKQFSQIIAMTFFSSSLSISQCFQLWNSLSKKWVLNCYCRCCFSIVCNKFKLHNLRSVD